MTEAAAASQSSCAFVLLTNRSQKPKLTAKYNNQNADRVDQD